MTTTLHIGDSLCHPSRWPGRLELDWESVCEPGTTAAAWLPQLPASFWHRNGVSEREADWAVVNLGANDALNGVDPATFAARLEWIRQGVEDAPGLEGFALWVSPFYPESESVCRPGDVCLSQASVLACPEHYETEVCVHPNEEGEALMAAAFMAAVPEPSASILLSVGIIALAVLRRAGKVR